MGEDLKKEARRQYLKYFRVWFVVIGILVLVNMGLWLYRTALDRVPRANREAPAERVYDYGDMLTVEQEEELRAYIARKEKRYKIDIVLVTMRQPVEGREAQEEYGYRSPYWEQNMQDLADDFWDEHRYGYNKGFEGDGALLLDNRYEGQRGEHLSTSGKVEYAFDVEDVNDVLDGVDRYYDTDPLKAYKAYVDGVCGKMGHSMMSPGSILLCLVSTLVATLVYAASHMSPRLAEDTTRVNTYVEGGKPELKHKSDNFVRKSLTKRHIETSSSGSSSSGRSGGGGGHHRSSSGASHGGGSRRH